MVYFIISVMLMAAVTVYYSRKRRIVTPERLQEMVRAEKVYIIDCRKKESFDKGHINGARNVPGCNVQRIESILPDGEDISVVLYGEAVANRLAKQAAVAMRRSGKKGVFHLDGGWRWWVEKMQQSPEEKRILKQASLDPGQFSRFLQEQKEEYVIIDVSGEKLYNEGHLKGAVNIPMEFFEDRLQELPRDKHILLTCQTGRNSGQAALFLAKRDDFDTSMIHYLNATIEYKAGGRMVLLKND